MTVTLRLTGPRADAAEEAGTDLLRLIGDGEVSRTAISPAGPKRDLGTGLAIVGIVLAAPGAINSTIDLARRLELSERLAALKARLEATGTEATLELGCGRSADLRRTPTDALVDLTIMSLRSPRR